MAEDTALAQRVATLEKGHYRLRLSVDRHSEMLEGELGLDRVMRNFIERQDEREDARKRLDVWMRWAIGMLVVGLVGLMEWHPWR